MKAAKYPLIAFATALAAADPAFAACPKAPTSLPLIRPAEGKITKRFGLVRHPILATMKLHAGVDFAGPENAPIVAAAAGEVVDSGRRGPMGNYVEIDHGNGTRTAYAHLATIAVPTGACVAAGDRIGTRGSTGLTTGPSLHFEVRREGRAIDPESLLQAESR